MSFIFDGLKGWLRKLLKMFGLGPKPEFVVVVKVNSGERVSVEGDNINQISDIAEQVSKTIQLQPDQELRFILAGKELKSSTTLQECGLGQQSILHAVRVKARHKNKLEKNSLNEEEEEGSQPLAETLLDLQLSPEERNSVSESERSKVKAHFYVWCSTCRKMCEGKLRVVCDGCGTGAFTVHFDPQSWEHVLKPHQITGECLAEPSCSKVNHDIGPSYAEFYFKCAEHSSQENDRAVPLYLIKPNIKNIPCLACSDLSETVLVFPCDAGHVTCLECFKLYCTSRLHDRQFFFHTELGYTLPCPAGCENSYIEEIHHFKLLSEAQYNQYQRFGTEEFVLQSGGVLCPQPDCGMGILIDPGCMKVTCTNGCGYVFCVKCLQGYHIGDCGDLDESPGPNGESCQYNFDPARADQSRWDAATKVTIRVTSKPCPACRTPTERDGGCMHMVCVRAGCKYEWCWVCQTKWTRECMSAHWFG